MKPVAPLVLIVEPDHVARGAFAEPVERGGFHVVGVDDGAEAVAVATSRPLAAILLGPGTSASQLLRDLRAAPGVCDVPVVVLSDRADEIDRVVAFELGADEVLVQPFSMRELLVRLRTLIRRADNGAPRSTTLRFGDCELDTRQMRVRARGREVHLSVTEFWLLEAIVRRGGAVVPRAVLLNEVWAGASLTSPRTLDTLIRRVRAKLGPCGGCVETVRSVGFRLAAAPPAVPPQPPLSPRALR